VTPNLHVSRIAAVKKNLAAYRYLDEKVIPLYIPEATQSAIDENVSRATSFDYFVKRAFDFVFATFVLVFGFPFYMLIALLIKLTSEGPVLFAQERVGHNGEVFRLYKFRTMMNGNCDKAHRTFAENFIKGNGGSGNGNGNGNGNGSRTPVFKLTEDPRVTSIGRFLRKTSLDELPQFINVLRGEMTVVGPRPPLTYELDHYHDWHKKRLTVKPGLTGLWQVSGRSMVPFDEMVMLDLYYIENWSILLDTKIILRTIPVMLGGSGGY
jgi:lipopolysaccharide/colanic/teichoic acid biosynthesis glycosyltransferase